MFRRFRLNRFFQFIIGAIALVFACGFISVLFNGGDKAAPTPMPATRGESLVFDALPAASDPADVGTSGQTSKVVVAATATEAPAAPTVQEELPTVTPIPATPVPTEQGAKPVLVQIATAPAPSDLGTSVEEPTATIAPVVEASPDGGQIPRTYANQEGNLRAGPGTEFEIAGNVAAGEPIEVLYKNPAGDWYQLGNGAWIAAFLVSGVNADLAVAPSLPAVPVVEQPPVVEAPPVAEQPAVVDNGSDQQCDPSYPDVCIPPLSVRGDLNCPDIPQFARFRVLAPDPHGFDKEGDGLGCESN